MSGGFMKTDISGKAEVVLTTKGDLATWDTARVRKGVSATNYTGLQADSSTSDGLAYGATARSTLTADQDLLVASGANTLSRLAKGSDNQTLMMNGTSINWETVSSGGATTALDNLSSVAVNATIDMNDQIIKDMKAGVGWGKLEEIESYEEASATGSTKTFTLTEDNLDLYDALVLTYSLTTTAAFNLEIVVDGISSGYMYSMSEDALGTFANTTATAQSQFVIMDSSILTTDTIYAMGQVLFLPAEQNEGAGVLDIIYQGGVSTKGNAWGTGHVAATLSSFGSITIQTSTSTWTQHSRFNLMGRRK